MLISEGLKITSYAIGNGHPDSERVAVFLWEVTMATMLVIDNYDSFTYNLIQMFRRYDLDIRVHRCDCIDLDQAAAINPEYILISPGPKDPAHAGVSKMLINRFYRRIPILGVCLGMQCINEVFMGKTVRANKPVHGKTSEVYHHRRRIFHGMPSPLTVARYHSLMVEPDTSALKKELMITARTEDNVIMGISHRRFPLHGVQFHPESFLSERGLDLVENFLRTGPLHAALERNHGR